MNRLLDFDNFYQPSGAQGTYKVIQSGLWYPLDGLKCETYDLIEFFMSVSSTRELLWI
jgi:hypothetical protein